MFKKGVTQRKKVESKFPVICTSTYYVLHYYKVSGNSLFQRCVAIYFGKVRLTSNQNVSFCVCKPVSSSTCLSYVTLQLFRQFRWDKFLSKLWIIVAAYGQISIKQCKQNNIQWKNNTLIQIETRFTRDYFCGGWLLSRKCSKSSIFVNIISWNCTQYIFIYRGAAYLMH